MSQWPLMRATSGAVQDGLDPAEEERGTAQCRIQKEQAGHCHPDTFARPPPGRAASHVSDGRQPAMAGSMVAGYGPGAADAHSGETALDAVFGLDAQATDRGEPGAPNPAANRAGRWDLWTEVHGSNSRSGSADSTLVIGYVGAHYFIADHALIGVLGQIDWAEETNASVNANAEGVGWMVGPYVAGQVPGHDVIYQARVAYGTSDNRVAPIGTYADSFDGTRFLASGKITGSYALGRLTIDPSAAIAWFQETQHAYTDTNGLFIPEQTISLGEARLGPSFSHELTLEDGMVLVPSLGVSAVYNFGISDSATSQGFALGDDALRARLDAGLLARSASGTSLALSGFFDGLGIDDYRAFGGQARLTIPLN